MHPSFDTLITSLTKLNALLKIASNSDITKLETETWFHYFWATEDVLEKAKQACENLAVTFFITRENHHD